MEKETVLVVHGEASVRNDLKSHLEGWGYQVLGAEDGARARDQFHSARPNLVLLAVHLPDASSEGLLTEFKAQNPDIPIIILADSGTIEEAVRCLPLGAYDVAVVESPAGFERLRHVIKNALELSRLKAQRPSAERPAEAGAEPVPGTLGSLAYGIPSSGIALFDVERDLIEQALKATGWNKSKAARLLRITRDTLRYKVKKYHLEEDRRSAMHPVDMAS